MQTPASAVPVYAQCPIGSQTARLVGVGVFGSNASGTPSDADVALSKVKHNASGGPTYTRVADDLDLLATPSGNAGYQTMTLVDLMDKATAAGSRASSTRIGTPLWCNATTAGPAASRSAQGDLAAVLALLVNGPIGSTISFVRFFVAHGM